MNSFKDGGDLLGVPMTPVSPCGAGASSGASASRPSE